MRQHHGRGVFALPGRMFRADGSASAPEAPVAPSAPAAPPTAPVVTPAAPVAASAPAAQPQAETPAAQPPEPSWLTGRLSQKERSTRTAVLAELGVANHDEAKALIAKARETSSPDKATAAKKDAEIRAAELSRLQELETIASTRAKSELSKLSPSQQTLILKRAGDDPARILSEIDDMQLLIASLSIPAAAPIQPQAPAPAPAATPEHKQTIAAPASTSAAPATPPASPPSAPNHLDVYEALRRDPSNAFAASAYLEKNSRAIYSQIEARRQANKK
jgi:hypothetical protein